VLQQPDNRYKKIQRKKRDLWLKYNTETAIYAATLWLGIPVLMTYWILVFIDDASFALWWGLRSVDPFFANLLISLGFAVCICVLIQNSVAYIYGVYCIDDEYEI
jgi:hypothetical protein